MLECVFCFVAGGFFGVLAISLFAGAKQAELQRKIVDIERELDGRTCFAMKKDGSMLCECSECGGSIGTQDAYCRTCGRKVI